MWQPSVLPGAPIGATAAAGSPQSPAAPARATHSRPTRCPQRTQTAWPMAPATTPITDVDSHAPATDVRDVAPVRPGTSPAGGPR
jgi:hypothetical protein